MHAHMKKFLLAIISLSSALSLIFPANAFGLSGTSMYREADFFGVNAENRNGSDAFNPKLEQWFQMIAAMGAREVRINFSWDNIQPDFRGQPYNWTGMDNMVLMAKRYDLRVEAVLVGAPRWAVDPDTYDADRANYREYPPWDNATDQYAPQLFADFVRAAVNRYKPHGGLSVEELWPATDDWGVTDWQIGNEFNVNPGLPGIGWGGTISQYVSLLGLSYNAVHAECGVYPACNVISGGVADRIEAADLPGENPYLWDAVSRFYNALPNRSSAGHFDTLDVRTYEWFMFSRYGAYPDTIRSYEFPDERWYADRLSRVIGVMSAYGDAGKKIWLGETGYIGYDGCVNSDPYGLGCLSEDGQAASLIAAYKASAAYPQVEKVFWWQAYETPYTGNLDLIRSNLTEKKAYHAYKILTGNNDYAYYVPWYDSTPSFAGDWLVAGNPGGTPISYHIFAGRNYLGVGTIGPNSTAPITFPNLMTGPVEIVPDQPLVFSQRALYSSSFNEISSVKDIDLDSKYYFTWYDGAGFANWVLVANPNTVSPVYYEIWIGGALRSSGSIPPGGTVTPQYPGLMTGPVIVQAWSDASKNAPVKVIASQRVLNGGSSFNEVSGIPATKLSDRYVWTWYDNLYADNWVLVANPNSSPAYFEIKIAGAVRYGSTLAPGEMRTPVFGGLIGGPVEVQAWTGASKTAPAQVVASQRVIWSKQYRQSFEELSGSPVSSLTPDNYWPWYDQASAGSRNWVLVANPNAYPVYYEINVGGAVRSSGMLNPGQNVTPALPGVMGGPVEVHAWINNSKSAPAQIYSSQRVLWNSSPADANSGFFNETMGSGLW